MTHMTINFVLRVSACAARVPLYPEKCRIHVWFPISVELGASLGFSISLEVAFF